MRCVLFRDSALDCTMLVFMLLCLYLSFILILCSPTVQVMYFGVAQGLNVTCGTCVWEGLLFMIDVL